MKSWEAYRRAFTVVLALLFVGAGASLALRWLQPDLTEEEVRRVIVTTVQDEAPASFYVTGELEITATSHVRNTKYLLPNVFRLDLGTTESKVRMPGRVLYGFDVAALRPEHIQVGPEGLIEVALPELEVYAVEPHLDAMEVETTAGWARLQTSSGRRVEQQALRHAQEALRRQGTTHLATATQPRVHTARALERLLTPVLQAAGVPDPTFRFRLGTDLVLESG